MRSENHINLYQGSFASSPGRRASSSAFGRSPTPSLRHFDRRFQARLSPSPAQSPRASSPAFLNVHSRQSSAAFQDLAGTDSPQTPWDVVRWTKLRKITGQAFSEIGKRSFGRPTCIAVSSSIAFGTSKGIILVFDYNQNLKSIIGPGTKGMSFSYRSQGSAITDKPCIAIECGSVTSISISADLSTIAGGHASGNIFTWELAKPAKPFLQISPVDRRRTPDADGHTTDAAILHLGFLGTRHTALVSADDKGMAFSHLATRGMGIVARTVRSTRILGRYPDISVNANRLRKPSSVLAFSPLPLGNAEHTADSMGLVAMLTPYLLVIVSTTPIAQTQYKTARPKELAHSAMSAALAWFPSVKLKNQNAIDMKTSRAKLVYCWSSILTVLEVVEVEPSVTSDKSAPPTLQFRPRSRWKAQEAIVAVQWLGRSVLAILTITQQLIILEDQSLNMTDSSDLIQKHIYHTDLFSPHLRSLVEELDEEDSSMHGVVADAFYMSFRAYKGRLFLLGYSEVTFGTLSNWADRLLAMMEEGSFIGAIELATYYYSGEGEKVTVGLPEDDTTRHRLVEEKLLEMMSASLKYAFGKNKNAADKEIDQLQIEKLAAACIKACAVMDNLDFLFEDVYSWYQDADMKNVFLESLESLILDGEVEVVPPVVLKDLVNHYTDRNLETRLESMLFRLDSRMMDIDQVTSLCKRNGLWDALLYVWSQALNDYTTILGNLLDLALRPNGVINDPSTRPDELTGAPKVFPYLSYILTGRMYPVGKEMPEDQAFTAKADIYHFFFSGNTNGRAHTPEPPNHMASYPNLRKILDYDAPSFLSMMNEAFEDAFLNGQHPQAANGQIQKLTEEQTFGSQVNRQWIVSILLEVMTPPKYEPEDTIYLNMFIARNLPKFPQFILLPGHVLHRVLEGLCLYPEDDISEDCQLSVEYLLSIYQPPDLLSLIPLLSAARFYRVLKSIYRTEKQYARLLKTCFEDLENPNAVFDCIKECLNPTARLDEKQFEGVREVIIEHASELVTSDPSKAASTIEQYARDLHGIMLQALDDDQVAQLRYLRTVLEPSSDDVDVQTPSRPPSDRRFIEQYVRLLCDYEPHHVSDYIEQLKSGDLRLEEVMPALENSGVVDAAVVLMAREGKVRDGIDRLTRHLGSLEAALLGLLDGAQESPDVQNTAESTHDLIGSVQKYARVGVWICRGQTKSVQQSRSRLKQANKPAGTKADLSADEELWLDLIDAVVSVAKNVSEVLEHKADETDGHDLVGTREAERRFDSSKLVTQLRTVVQETFTALLSTTSAPRTSDIRRTDASFLRIFQAFLSRASSSSSSLSNLRSVLSAIFSAYSYEESLLALANRLLDKDLFVHVTEVNALRRRGWRPLGQVCEGCGKRVWGPGAGAHIWEAWQRKEQERSTTQPDPANDMSTSNSRSEMTRTDKGKGTALTNPPSDPVASAEGSKAMGGVKGEDIDGSDREEVGSVVIFACRHLFHRLCLLKMQGASGVEGAEERKDGARGLSEGHDFVCPLCADC